MRVLLIKTSSMGDVIHALPALTDAGNMIADIRFDWVVENAFAEIPRWHPLVDKVIPIEFRRWRKGFLSPETRMKFRQLHQQLHENQYDLILDAQGLVKSAFLCLFAKGTRAGLNFRSAREPLASLVYQRKYTVNFYQHAVSRMRILFNQALDYSLPETLPDFGLNKKIFFHENQQHPYVVFLHGTTWESKQWPEHYWKDLADFAGKSGYRVKISGGNQEELRRAQRIAQHLSCVDVLPRLSIGEMAHLLANASAAVAVDTGFGHLAAALNVPTLSIYGSTNPAYTGAIGPKSVLLSASFPCSPCLKRKCTYKQPSEVQPPCYTMLTPNHVWGKLTQLLQEPLG